VKSLVWTRNVKQLNNSFHLHFDAISSSCGSLIVIYWFQIFIHEFLLVFILWAVVSRWDYSSPSPWSIIYKKLHYDRH
jgi:hypothetical protein